MSCAVLFLIFNRLEETKQVFEIIRKAQPTSLYISADGPRTNKDNEDKLCNQVRSYVLENIDWDCELKILFQDSNLGCKNAVIQGINWFFENEEYGIILEDDVVPSLDFFRFCNLMLQKYNYNEKIMMISGTNYFSNEYKIHPYFFSRYFNIWGWATWRRSWLKYDLLMKKWEDENFKTELRRSFKKNYVWRHYKNSFNLAKSNLIDTWDIQWTYSCFAEKGLCITPNVNLITNIGVVGTHSNSLSKSHFLKSESIDLNIINTIDIPIFVNHIYDEKVYKTKLRNIENKILILNIFKKIISIFKTNR